MGTSSESLREYIRGDDPHHIDWKASARHRKLIVRQYEADRSQGLLLVVDAGRTMRERIGGAASASITPSRRRSSSATSHAPTTTGSASSSSRTTSTAWSRRPALGLDRLARLLGEVESRPAEPDYPHAFRHLSRSFSRRSLVVVFIDVLGDRESRALLAHLTPTARRHLPILGALRNPSLEEVGGPSPADEAVINRRAAAEELLEQRDRALHRMRRRGVTVVAARPESALPETVNAYPDVKRRGLV